jgi:hypothetical protein
MLESELHEKKNKKKKEEARGLKKRWDRDGNTNEDFIIFMKTQHIILDALLHIFILLLLKKSAFDCQFG